MFIALFTFVKCTFGGILPNISLGYSEDLYDIPKKYHYLYNDYIETDCVLLFISFVTLFIFLLSYLWVEEYYKGKHICRLSATDEYEDLETYVIHTSLSRVFYIDRRNKHIYEKLVQHLKKKTTVGLTYEYSMTNAKYITHVEKIE
jgi:hypothetical protein